MYKYLLIEHNKGFVSTIAELLFQVDKFLNAVFNKLSLSFNEFLSFIGCLVEEARIDLTNIFKRYY